MFRKLLLTSVALLGLLVPLASAPSADAHEYRDERRHEDRYGHHHEHIYLVYYRDSCNRGWSRAGTFHNWHEASRFAEGYRCRGFEISIR